MKDHKMETRRREIHEAVCLQPGCKFKGKRAAQGHCFGKLDKAQDRYIDHVLKEGADFLREIKALRKRNKLGSDKAWIKYLEDHVVCQWANGVFTLDGLVYLRAENARLLLKLGKWGKK